MGDRIRRSHLAALFVFAVLVRIPVVVLKHPGFPPGWGGEMSAVATSLAAGDGYGSPYWEASGPTALVPPVYPALLGVMFRVAGGHTPLGGNLAFAVAILLSSAIVVPLGLLAAELFGASAGLVAAGLWAIWPLSGFTDALYLWNTPLYGLLLTSFLLLALRVDRETPLRIWVGGGILTGLLILTEPVSLTIVGLVFLWLATRRMPLRSLAVAALLAVLPATGWAIRNYIVFEQPVFLRSGFGLELANGVVDDEVSRVGAASTLPNRNPDELERYLQMGELAYMAARRDEALSWIRNHPGEYARRGVRRYGAYWWGSALVTTVYWFWGKLSLVKHLLFVLPVVGGIGGLTLLWRRRESSAPLLTACLLVYPVTYALTHTGPRFRLPLDPLLLALSSGLILAAIGPMLRYRTALNAPPPASIPRS